MLSILYKVFSKIVCNRIRWILDKAQPVDQAGFRPGFGCDDHLLAMTIIWEQCNEFQLPVWIAAVDFTKAFDTVEHASLWAALSEMGVPQAYIRVFAKLYKDQYGIVVTDKESRKFEIKRGTKQGDPTSPNLFNAVLEYALADAQKEWRKKGWGLDVGTGRLQTLCNLRFAGDVLLFASSKYQLKCMLEELAKRTKDVGLEIHRGKTKILTNMPDNERDSSGGIDIEGETIKILALNESTMYLGRKLTFGAYHDTEIDHRIACGWAKFNQYKKELCCRHYPLIDRLRLFESVITPTVLYSAGTWTMNAARMKKLKVAQRRMLRNIVQVVRRRGRAHDSTMLETNSEETELEDERSQSSASSECILSQKLASNSSSSTDSEQ